MKSQVTESRYRACSPSWSNRILIVAVAGILFLTLFPFRFAVHAKLAGNDSPFLLGTGGKYSGSFNVFLNVLLFVPIGFGLTEKLRERGKSRGAALLFTMAAGAIFSYAIEFIQIYIPTRDSGWEDVFTNATGSVVGFFLFELLGKSVLKTASEIENRLDGFLTAHRALLILSLYFAFWFAVSVPLQKESQLTNWVPDSQLLVGNDAAGRLDRSWKGEISRLQLWDRALPAGLAEKITSGEMVADATSNPLATYEFSNMPPFQDQGRFLPELMWTSSTPDLLHSHALYLDGKSWLTSQAPVARLVKDFQETKKFSVRVVCAPAEVKGSDGRIVSISQGQGLVNLAVRQEDANLVFWFRNPLSVRRALLAWSIPDIFVVHQNRDILFSYDGSNLSLYIDGKKNPRIYQLTPGTGLAQLFRRIKTSELEGYNYIYYALLFIPGGSLIGIAARRITMQNLNPALALVIGLLIPAIFFELMLIWISGRMFSFVNIVLSILLAISGSLWISADRRPSTHEADLCSLVPLV
jgi:glycopeptide antibiotics resistance protein